jgi:hypothetical protein
MPRLLESTAISILEGDTTTPSTFSNEDTMELIEHLQAWLPNYPKGSNKFISFLHQYVSPIHAVYGVYSAVDNGSLELTSRNFQSMLLFESEFKDLIKHLSNPDKKTNFFESMRNGTDISKVELELTSPFCIQPENEIGTGTYDQQVAIEDLFTDPDDDATVAPQTTTAPAVQTTTKSPSNTIQIPLKDILDTAAKKVFGVGVKKTDAEKDQEQDDRDAYHVYTQYLYQFTGAWFPNDAPTINVVSQKFWDDHEYLDFQPISEYLEAIIPDWSNNWCETTDSVFEYTGGSTKAEAIAYLKATGFFKQKELFDDKESDKTDILLSYLEGQPKEVISKFLKEALTHLDDSQIADLIQKYEDAWHETVE